MENNKEENIDVSFKGNGKDSIWIFEPTQSVKTASGENVSKYVEQDYSNAMVKCINPQLESVHEQTGVVVQVIPGTNYVEVDVDFGRGLGIQRMAEEDIEIILSE